MTATDRGPRSPDEVVQRALHWVAVGLLALNLPLSTGRVLAHPRAYQPWFAAVVLTAMWVLLASAVVQCVRRVSAARPLQGFLAVSCAALLGHPWLHGAAPVPYPPLFHVLGAALCVSAVVGVYFSAVLIPVFAAYVAAVRSPILGWRQAAAEACLLAVSAYIATGTVDVLHRANRSVTTAVRATARAVEDRIRAYRRAYERERWNGLVHDKVLGALRIAATSPAGVPATARELARQARAAFHGDPLTGGASAAADLREFAAFLGLTVDVRLVENDPDPELRQAFLDAAREALTNVSRHSGASTVTVIGRLDGDEADLTVADDGRGFDPASQPPRAGIASSITGRVRAVGGAATVTSRPGRGTSVQLTWAADSRQGVEEHSDWQLRTFAPVMIIGVASVALNVLIGTDQWLHSRMPTMAAVGIAAIVFLTVAVALGDPSGWAWLPVVAAAVGICALLAVNIPLDAGPDWRYWFLGALTPAVGATAFRYRAWAGLGAAAAMTVTVCLIDAMAGRPALACLTGPVPVLVGTAVAGHLLRASMNDAWQQVVAQDSERARLRLEAAVEEERSRETATRVSALAKAVEPDLELIETSATITAQDRDRILILEGTTRDHLAAPDLLDAPLIQALGAARRRGVRVDVVPGGSSTGSDTGRRSGDGRALPTLSVAGRVQDSVATYRRVLVVALEQAPARARVRAVWRQSADTAAGTITVVMAEAERLAEQVAGMVDDLPVRLRVSGDEDAVLVEVPSAGR